MTLPVIEAPSPNWNERPAGTSIDTVVLHYTGMTSGEAALERLRDTAAEVSAHYLIEEDGRLFRLVAEEKRAWHAGVSVWQGQENINHNSIGIEIVNPGHEFGYRPFPAKQIDTLITLLSDIKNRHTIRADRFVGHSDIAPARKLDPGELFPWERLAGAGFGLWSGVDGSGHKPLAKKGDCGNLVAILNKQLGIVGYSTGQVQSFDATTEWAVRAFQAHWRAETVTGIFDEGTAARLEDLTAQVCNIGESL